MLIELTNEQVESLAIQWIKNQQQEYNGYKKVLNTLLVGAHFAKWGWHTAILHAIKVCSRNYAMTTKQIIKGIQDEIQDN